MFENIVEQRHKMGVVQQYVSKMSSRANKYGKIEWRQSNNKSRWNRLILESNILIANT
jgi:hypothetical protein